MDEKPNRVPEGQPEPPPFLGRRRRLISTASLTLGVCGSLLFGLCIYSSYVVPESDRFYFYASGEWLRYVTGIVFFYGLGPGLVLLGLAIRRIIGWRQFTISLAFLAVAVTGYLIWWWANLPSLP